MYGRTIYISSINSPKKTKAPEKNSPFEKEHHIIFQICIFLGSSCWLWVVVLMLTIKFFSQCSLSQWRSFESSWCFFDQLRVPVPSARQLLHGNGALTYMLPLAQMFMSNVFIRMEIHGKNSTNKQKITFNNFLFFAEAFWASAKVSSGMVSGLLLLQRKIGAGIIPLEDDVTRLKHV